MVEHVERETLAEVSLEIQPEEVVSPLKEIPGMVKLNAPQLGKTAFLISGAESIVENGCHEDCGRANGTSDKLVVLAGDEIQGGRVESGHEVARKRVRRGCGVLFIFDTSATGIRTDSVPLASLSIQYSVLSRVK